MPKTLKISATEVRKDFFNILDLVSQDAIQVHISKRGIDSGVILQKSNQTCYVLPHKTDVQRVCETAGVLKTSGYKKNEIDLAQDQLVKEYFEKNPKGPDA